MQEKDYYKILEVEKDATQDEIRRAFQKKARLLHPDVNKEEGAEEKFKELSEAYAVLGDPDKRKRYDAMRSNPFMQGGYSGNYSSPSSSGFEDLGGFSNFGGFGNFSDIFNFASRQSSQSTNRAYNPQEGSDIAIEITLTSEEARKGCTKSVSYQHYAPCSSCSGTGSDGKVETMECPSCSGKGSIELNLEDFIGFSIGNITCPECEGSGRVIKNPCNHCMGTGREAETITVNVSIDPHAYDMQKVRIVGKGNAGTNGDEAGDLIVRIAVPEERLTIPQVAAFRLFGFALTFMIFATFMPGGFMASAPFAAIPMFFALYLLIKNGITNRSRGWWKSGFNCILSGAQKSLILCLIITIISCSTNLGH